MFTPIVPSSAQSTVDRCNYLMNTDNQKLSDSLLDFKNSWINFWDPGLDIDSMQAQLDLLATTPAVDQGVTTSALGAYFAKALRFITYISIEFPTAFTTALKDSTGTYTQFLQPGWVYTMQGSRMVVSAPVDYVPDA